MATILRYRKIVWVFILLLLFTGIFTYFQLPKREIPEINVNLTSLSTVYPGATPQEVERTITNPLESELSSINGIEEISSASTTGFSTITATLADGADKDNVNSKIQQAVSDASRNFPDEAKSPEIETDLMMSAAASYHLIADNYETLYNLHGTLEKWKEELTNINGVEAVEIKGLPDREIKLTLNNEKLNDNKVSPFQVIDSVNKELAPDAIGTTEKNDKIYQLVMENRTNIDSLTDIKVAQGEDGPILVRDVGKVNTDTVEPEDLITFEGKPALSITLLAEEGVNMSSLQSEVSNSVDELSADLPDEVKTDRFYTQNTIIEEVFTNLLTSFAVSLLAVFFIMIIGLQISSAILVGLAVPISIIIGLIPLPYTGVDLNQISIIGMIIAIGILVDDAIVVNDNVQRRLQLGDAPLEGTIKGVKEVGLSIITSTLMIIFSFLPLTFLSGSNGDFIRALPMVLILTIIASTIMALTFIPTIQYARNKKASSKPGKKAGLLGGVFTRMENLYADRLLPKVTKRPWTTGLLGLLACVLLALLILKIPFEFFPSADRPEVTVSVTYPQGTTLEETKESIEKMEEFLVDNNTTITETAVYAGSGLPNLFSSGLERSGENTGQLLVRIDREKTSATAFINDWEKELRSEFENAEIFLDTIESGPPASPPIVLKIQGPELDQLIQFSKDIQSRFAQLESLDLTTLNAGSEQPFIRYQLDRELLAENNITDEQVTSLLQVANTGIPMGIFDNGKERLPITAIVDDGKVNGVNLEDLQVTSQSTGPNQNPSVKQPSSIFSLEEIITKEEFTQAGAIPHLDGKRTFTLEAYPKKGEETTFEREANDLIAEIKKEVPEDYQVFQTGESNARTEFFIEVAKLFVIVLFLIYLTIAIQFNSLTMPLLITSSVFLAVTGAIIGLFVFGQPLSFLAVLGIVSLSGIAVRNSVILVEFIEQNRNRYETIVEAVTQAGRARLRPIILTSLTSIAALAPIIFTGDVLFRPLAISIVSGLLFSTLLTLLLVPAFYLMLFRIRRR
ncbi:efflux RND transporter permease subunit [Thalassobacillus devorans]|uniref:efflux RND transporter permease subunit n=1 Tax=Thalassobacillus devorans TaxID=279813 RepID=UPI00048D1C2D|nr:efflux RND transporter permease subunit [Thalassobacillus devorans]